MRQRDGLRLSPVAATLGALAAALLWTFVAGCDCGGGDQGDACDDNEDCDPGLYCEVTTLTCQPVDDSDGATPGDSAATDSGGDADDAHIDSGTGDAGTVDAGGPNDGGTDSSRPDGGCIDLLDDDGDGFTFCDGDCDDTDPTRYPGAPEICGDGLTNDCDSTAPPDVGCVALGTFVAPPPVGSPSGTGTQSDPVDTINAAMTNSQTIELMGGPADLPVYVAAGLTGPGVYDESIIMDEGVSLVGGFEPVGWTRDTTANITIINPQPSGLYAGLGITRATSVEGFTFNAMRSSLPASGPTTAIEIEGGEPTIRGNIINAIVTSGIDVGIRISDGGAGGAPSALIIRNIVNAAGGGGFSAGIVADLTATEIVSNNVNMAGGPYSVGINCAGCDPSTYIGFNIVDGTGASSDGAAGIEIEAGGAILESNQVNPGTCAGGFIVPDACIGVNILTGGLPTLVFNNIILGGAGEQTVGLNISYLPSSTGTLFPVQAINNYIYGGDPPPGAGTTESVGVALRPGPGGILIGPFEIVHVQNNIIHAGTGDDHFGIREYALNLDPVDVLNNDFVVLPGSGLPGALAVYYRDEIAFDRTTIAMVNALTDVAVMNNVDIDCMLVNPIWLGNFHLTMGSMCIDAGIGTLAPTVDFEGDPRGTMPDIGPDEY